MRLTRLASFFFLFVTVFQCFTSRAYAEVNGSLQSDASSRDFRFLGIAKAQQYATLRIPKQGIVQSVIVKEGQNVLSGEKLLSLDDRVAQAALFLAKTEAANSASIKISKIERDRATIAFERAQSGFQQNVVGQFELDAKKSELGRATAAYELELERRAQSIARLNMAQQEVDSLSLFAPFDGTVTRIHAKPGDPLGPSENAITIANLDTLEIELHLPLDLFGTVTNEKSYQVMAGAPVDKRLDVVIKYVAPEVESTSGTFRAVFVYDNRQTRFPTGFEVFFATSDNSTSPRSRFAPLTMSQSN